MTRDYSAAIDAVFGPVEEAAPAPSFTLPADAANTSGGINAALDAMPGMVERGARERLTPAPAPLAPEFPWSNPTAAWYTPPEEKAAEGISTQMLRGQMAEREITRHALFPEGENDDGAGGLLRASFMLNNASRYSQDDIFTAATLSAANGMPFDLTLDSLDKARDMLTEFTPANVRDFAPGFLRLVQYDYDSAMLWRHDIPTANAIAGSFDFTPDEDSRAAALGRGLSGAGTMLLQVGVNLGRMGLEGLAALARGVDENYQPAALADRPMAAALLETSDTMLDWVRQLSERQKEISAESPLAGMKVWDNPEVLLDSRWWLENTPQAAASLLPMLGAYATGGKLAAGLMGLAMNGNEVYVDLLNAGMEDNTATRLWSLTGGVAMSALDVVGLTGILGGREAVRAAVKTALATAARGGLKDAAAYAGKGVVTGYLFEGGTEYAQNLVKAGIEAMARGKDFGGVVAAIGEAAIQLEDFILGGLMGGVIRGGHDVVQVRGERRRQALQASIAAAAKSEEVTEARAEVEAIVRDNAEAQRRMAFAQSLLQTAEAADSSALHQADPAIFEREAEKLMPEDARSVWLDVDMVREFAGEDNARLEALGLSPRDMADAVQIQAGSVRVPTVRLVSRFQGEDRILLLQSARMTPDGMTLTEARAFDPRKRSEAAAERIRARNRVNAEIGKERTRLKNEFAQAGYAAHVAEYYATMHAEQARAFADRYGSDAAQLLRERSIVRGNAEAAGQARPWQTAFDKSPDSFFSQGAMAADSSLPRRFAEMPGIEADSSQWFGEGKAIALPGKIETPEQRKALRGALKQWAKENFSRDTAVVNADTGWQVQVTPKGIEDSLSHGLDEPLARSVPFIPQIVESGIHVATTEKKAGLMSHIFANKIRLDGKDYAVGFVLREDRRGNRFYDHELTEIIDPDWLAPGRDTSEEALGHRTNRGDVMNILRDRLGVNDGSGQVLFQASSMKPSLPQRFAEMPDIEADSSQWFGEGKAIAADTKNLRKNLKKWAKENFSGKTAVANADTGWEVRVTPKSVENSLSHGFDEPLARSVPFIPQIVESGIHVATIEKKAGLMSHIFANKIRLDGKGYVVGFVVREDANGNRFYDHELTEIIDPGWLYQDHFQKKENWYTEPANRGHVMNILRDKLGVNDGSGQVLFQAASMKPSLPRRFAEMPGIEADSSQWFGEGKAIALPGKIETPEQRKALRGALKQWAKENFSRDTAVVNADTGWQVQVTPKGIEDSLSHGLDEPLARSVPFIPQIVESGIHVDSIRKTPQLISHLFANKIRLDGKDYVVGFVLREDVNGNRFYDHELTEIIDPDWLAPGHPSSEGPSGEGSSGHRTNRGDVMNILRDRLGVNDGSGQVLFQAASMKPSLPRRFAEMPGIEADSSQWFGEGKAIAADGQNTRKAVVDWARSAFPQGMTIRNADQGWAVQVTPNGIKASLHHGYDDLLARSVPFIPQIVESGIHVASTEKKAGLMSHIFANKIRLDGKDYVVGFVLREDKMGNRFYDHELTEIIDPDWLKPGRDTSAEALGHRTNRGHVMNILRDRLGVNDGSGRVMFQPDSDPANARGMVQFRADGSSVTSIFAGASDLSTPIHEGAHIFINDLIRVVAGGWRMAEQLFAREFTAVSNDASIDDSLRQRRQRALTRRWNKHKMGLWQAREDLAALVENANAQREAHGKAIGAHLPPVTLEEVVQGTATPEQIRTLQEVNAVSFEGYVREGRAPSSRLAAVFHKMRQWLAAIYRLAGIHGVKVTPEVRRVFDRMLANDEAIRKSAAGTALAGEGEFLSIVRDEEAELVIDESGQWKRKDRINYKAALNRQSEHERLQELYERAEAHVTARMDKATLRDRNKRWKAYYDEGREMARGDVYYEIVAALTVKEGNPWSGISRAWLEQQYGKAAVADFMKTAQGRRLLNKNGGQTLDAVGVGDIVGNMDRAVAMGIADADGLYNYLYDNVVTRRRSLADDARAWADQRMADDDARAEETGNDPGEAYRAYLEEVEATVLRLAARQDAGWRTPEQQARWVEEQRTPLTQVRRQVKSILRGRPLKEILPNQFVGEVRKALQERNAALAAGNALDALAAVDRARTALESWIEANRIRKEQEDFERLAKRLSALKRDVVVPEAWTAIQDMLERFELAARRRAGDSPVTLGEAVAALCADSAEINGLPAIAEWLLNEKESGSYRNLTAEQLRDVSDALKMLEHMGREALAGNKASEAARVREVADAGMENMSGLAPVSVAREGTAWRKWQDWMRSYFGGMLSSIQWQLRQADGFSNLGPEGRRGISEERIYGAIVDGETRREVRMRGLVERMEPVFRRLADSARKWEAERGKALTGADGKPLPVPEIMRRGGKLNWTADRVIALAMNLGNEGNALRLREGYPDLTADTLARLVGDDATRLVFSDWQSTDNEGLLSAQDWRDVQEVGNILQSQWKDIQATHERMFGFKPRGVEARPMTIRVKGESVSLNGWYYPAVYDPSLSPEVQKRQEQQDAIVRTEAVCAAPAAKRGFTRARANGGGGAPLLLETGVIMAHLNDVTRFIELAETVRFADRVTRSAQWRDAYIRAFGRQDYDAIRPNLKGIVLEERPATDAISKSADWLRERLVPWGLAFNFKTALLQSTAIFPAMNDLGAANVLRGVAAVARGRYALVRQIWEQSPYMKSRARNIDQDLRKTLRGVDARTRQKTLKLLGKEISWQDVVDAGMLPLVSVDMAASSAIWMAAYNREMAILANSRNVLPGIDPASEHHAAAVRAADMAVKAINPDFNPSSRSQFLRSRGAVRLLNIFSSAVVLFAQRRAYNAAARRQAIHAGGGGYRARLAAWGTYARYEAYDFALQGIAMGLVLSLAYGEDEPDKWAKNMGGAWLDAASMRVPVFNSMITGLITGDTWRGMSTVYQQPWDMAKRLRGAARTGEADKLTASMADVLSFLVKVPASRVWRNAERGYEQWEKGEGTPASVLMPRPNSY